MIPENIANLRIFRQFDPVRAQLVWQFPSIVLGVLFILLARVVKARMKRAFPYGLALIFISLLYVNLGTPSFITSLFLILTLLILFIMRPLLTRSQFIYSLESLTKDLGLILLALALYIYCNQTRFTFAHLHHVKHFRPEHYIGLWGEYAAGALVIAFLVFLSLLYLKGPTKPFGEEFHLERLQSFLEKWDTDTDSGLAFLGDKRFFWYQEEDSDQVVFQFAQERNKIVVMSEPIGNPNAVDQAIVAFLAQAKEANLEVIFYEVGQATTLTLHEHGYEFMKFGERAMVDLTQFNIAGKHGRKYRAVIHRLEKQGYTFQILQPPFDDKMLIDLKKVSDSWLQGRQEKGFSLGFFAEEYLQEAPLVLVANADKELVAFANTMPGRHDKVGSVDLM